jgi:DNA-binding NarL/FixJ family response regulator
VTALVAHPSQLVGEGMASAVSDRFGLDTVWTTTLEQTWRVVEGGPLEIAVLDAALAPGHEVEVCARFVSHDVTTVVVTPHDLGRHLDLLEKGAAGIAVASDGLEGVLRAVSAVLDGHVHLPPHLLGAVLHELILERRQQEPHPSERLDHLSPREREVLWLLGRGSDTRDIAARLVISPHTAKTHINRVLGKLGLSSRTEAATFAITHSHQLSLTEATHD